MPVLLRNAKLASISGMITSGARRRKRRPKRRAGRSERGGNPRIVSRLSATASRSNWRFTRLICPPLIAVILRDRGVGGGEVGGGEGESQRCGSPSPHPTPHSPAAYFGVSNIFSST